MADISNRPYSKNYSGLINQSVVALCITGICVTWHEFASRKRRGKMNEDGLGSRESWEFGYLYQGRSWAKNPSPPLANDWPLSWIKHTSRFSEEKLLNLRGIDATLYTRFLRGCFWFAALHTFTTFLVLFPVHLEFSDNSTSPRSMTRASISSLVVNPKGLDLLWIHMSILVYITLSWMATLYWLTHGVFRMRAQQIAAASERSRCNGPPEQPHPHPHPHSDWPFPPAVEPGEAGLRCRTVIVSNIPPSLRSEAELKEYFQFYMARRVPLPSVGLPSATPPGFLNKVIAFLFNRVRRAPAPRLVHTSADDAKGQHNAEDPGAPKPRIDRVIIARKMTELASLLYRREEVLHYLESAHLKLAKRTLGAVQDALDRREESSSKRGRFWKNVSLQKLRHGTDVEKADQGQFDDGMDLLIRTLSPYLSRHNSKSKTAVRTPGKGRESPPPSDSDSEPDTTRAHPPTTISRQRPQQTVWEALLDIPRSYLDQYQPLVRLNVIFRGKTVPAIDYYTVKLKVLTELITENRAKATADYDAVSTAFVTFADPRDARRACKYLAVHPNNPLTCLVTMAPAIEDLDWQRVMQSQFKIEFLKDWVVNIGVWTFTLFWLIPVSALIGLVSIQNVGAFWPGLKHYLSKHPWQEEVIQSLVPTLLVALLTVLVPLLLLLIAQKAHNVATVSALHDVILTRYYKFLIVNVLVFFCVGTAFVQTLLKATGFTNRQDILHTIATTFPTAGPFYVGWLIFTAASHGGFELALFVFPLIMHPSMRQHVTPRKRSLGLRPCTFNYWYWLPNHILVVYILLLFSVLNPLVMPFSMLYFLWECGVVKNQMLHVYSKNYERNGQVLLIRIIRYTLDGLILTQAVFLAYMVVLEKKANVGVSAALIVFTAAVKIYTTRACRARFAEDDLAEALVVCGIEIPEEDQTSSELPQDAPDLRREQGAAHVVGTWRRPDWLNFSYSTVRPHPPRSRPSNPFGPKRFNPRFSQLAAASSDKLVAVNATEVPQSDAEPKAPVQPEAHAGVLQTFGPVARHPPPIPWDDQSHIDMRYDNPFYTSSIQDVLWLPRDPLGIMDLDDTVDLRKSITCDPSGGELGTFIGRDRLAGVPHYSDNPKFRPSHRSLPRLYTGTEEIELPSAIAARVQTLADDDDEVEEINEQRPPLWSRRSGSSGRPSHSNTPRLRIARPSTFIAGDGPRSGSSTSALPRSASLLFTNEHRNPSGPDLGTRPDLHAQADFVRSVLSLTNVEPSRGDTSQSPQQPSKLSTQEALEVEVQAEEARALEQRLEQEGVEEDAAKGRYLWWIPSWMFRSSPSPTL